MSPASSADTGWIKACERDPFVRAHAAQVARVLEIGAGLSPLSIRDQMFRAAVAVDRAWEYGLISRRKPLLVAGGSAAGVTAAMRAARYGVPTRLIEEQDHLFFRQHECVTRWVSPTQYDWPAPHAGLHLYPWDSSHPAVELSWPDQFSSADQLAERWNGLFESARRNYSALAPPLLETRYIGAESSGFGGLIVRTDPSDVVLGPTSLLIKATGLGEEKCSFDGHHGYEFWGRDPYLAPRLGCIDPPRVLISGAGDGSLQDVVRIVTGMNSAMELYQFLPLDDIQRRGVEAAVSAAEDHYQRSVVWSTKRWDCELLRRLHLTYGEVVGHLAHSFWDRLAKKFHERPGSMRYGVDFRELTFHHSCDHFGRCYALNHFVVLVLCEFLRRAWGANVLVPGTRLCSISSSLSCAGLGAGHCHGRTHEIVLSGDLQCNGNAAVGVEHRLGAEVLVIRHGIKGIGREMRQTVPMFMPW